MLEADAVKGAVRGFVLVAPEGWRVFDEGAQLAEVDLADLGPGFRAVDAVVFSLMVTWTGV